jgi:hypothetical protein
MLPGAQVKYVRTEAIVAAHLKKLFKIYEVAEQAVISVTSNADISMDEEKFDEDNPDFLNYMAKLLRKRERLAPVRLELQGMAPRLAKMLSGFDCRVIAYDIYWDAEAAARLNVEYADIDTIRREADVISLHVPSTPQTNGMINKDFLSGMKKNAILVNTARGALVVAQDLADALNEGVIAGAGMDVFSPEPPLPDNPLLTAKNTVLLPHSGACTIESHEKAGMMAAKNVADFFAGREVKTILNPTYIEHI